MIGFGQDNPSDSAKSWSLYIEGQASIVFYQDYAGSIIHYTNALEFSRKSNAYSNYRRQKYASAFIFMARAAAYYNMEEWELAIDDYNSYIKLTTDIGFKVDQDAYRGRAYSLMEIDNYELAIEDYNTLLAISFDSNYVLERAICYYSLEDYQNAIIDLNTLIDNYGMNELLVWRAKSYFFVNKYHSSISDINEILKSSEDSELICLKGYAYAMLNSESLACSNFKKACSLGNKTACKLSELKGGVCFPEKIDPSNYPPKNITNSNKIELPIIVEGNMNFIMVTIGNKRYKYLIDTGASDMIINSDIERNLINLGYLKESDYRKPRVYEIANGKHITLKIANLSYIKIDNNRFDNIDIAIGDENASLLLGMSFINRFDWKITNNTLDLLPK